MENGTICIVVVQIVAKHYLHSLQTCTIIVEDLKRSWNNLEQFYSLMGIVIEMD
jgi:hypothetical protein